MNILIVGYGSIGQRHYTNCLTLKHDAEIFSLHEKRTSLSRTNYDLIIIASKTSDHYKDILRFKQFSKNFFIEKPLAANLKDAKKLKKALAQKKVVIGYSMIFHPLMRVMKEVLEKNLLGDTKFAQIHCGSFLPLWRKGDYRNSYSAHKKKGGGVLLDLIHEINYAQYLFPEPIRKVFGYSDKISSLDITSDDTALIALKQKKRYIHITLNCWQKLAERYVKIYGEDGVLFADLLANHAHVSNQDGKKIFERKIKSERNQMYVEELKFASQYIEGKVQLPHILSINQAIKDLAVVGHVA